MKNRTPKSIMDVPRLKIIGWEAKLSLEHGMKDDYQWFLLEQENLGQS